MAYTLTPKIVAAIVAEEAIVREAYLDAVQVWTWGIGVTDASGHSVKRYKDNPQSLEKCLEVGLWLLKEKYLPPVEKAFKHPLSENELAAALSFHWNTGKISSTEWVKLANDNKWVSSQKFLETHYTNNGLLTARRKRESRLFFNNEWPDLTCTEYPVSPTTHHPIFSKGKKVDILPILETMF